MWAEDPHKDLDKLCVVVVKLAVEILELIDVLSSGGVGFAEVVEVRQNFEDILNF